MICTHCGDDHVDLDVCACGCTHRSEPTFSEALIALGEATAWTAALEGWIERQGLTVPTWNTVNQ